MMKWTNEKPTEPGIYLVHDWSRLDIARVYVPEGKRTLRAIHYAQGDYNEVYEIVQTKLSEMGNGLMWAGPIKEPES